MTDSKPSLKKQQVFDSPTEEEPSLRGAHKFNEEEFIAPPQAQVDLNEMQQEVESRFEQASPLFDKEPVGKDKRRWSLLAKGILVGFIGLVVTETGLSLRDVWLESPFIFGLYLTLTLLVSLWAGKIAFTEWRKLHRLKSVEEAQQRGDRLALSMQMGEADKFIGEILSNLPSETDAQKYINSAQPEHNDAEKLILFEELVLTERDLIAKKVVRRYAQESALLLAASPLAVLDMAIILWRNQRMIVKIAQCYGIELGYWSRIKLIRGVITNIIYAGTSEIATDLGTQLLSVEMTGKLSARLAQGLGGGLLTARLGYQAMELCRPLSFKEGARPKLSGIHKELLLDLKELSSSVLKQSAKEKVARNKEFTSET
ncbi:TIGR01620 family protein [Shewanella sp. UCD-KL12]|uniref:TIGR01620 family protein n=1 Tax=Shewanella sp. UCD-KL12 TaxID=1917163 RepID=UPI0009FAD1D4|nr:TIGR01620 family protein [Shewanella sp. UCD-KL12]